MKILFICTSLEPGRDGVGDYTRILADACARVGHTCRMLAINDTFVSGTAPVEEVQHAVSFDDAPAPALPCLRLSSAQDWSDRTEAAAAWGRAFSPDWQSWQIVPYGFNPRGVIPREARELAAAFSHGPSRRHAMLHELWIGLSKHESLRDRIVGSFQRRALKKFMRALHPEAMDTSNPTYLTTLVRNDLAASHLPLYGNIPIVPGVEQADSRAPYFTGVIFGTIHAQFLPVARQSISILLAGTQASARTLRIIVMGHTGVHGEALMEVLQNCGEPGQVEVQNMGEIPAVEVSRVLQAAHFGIATHPWALLGKSGAVAAMLDHGLPVFVPRDEWSLRGRAAAPFTGYWPYASGLVARLADTPPEHMAGWVARRRAPANRADEIAAQFIDHLVSTDRVNVPVAV